MRNEYNDNHHLMHNRNAFLPMLCSKPSSLKDVHVPISLKNVSPSPFDPLSPRVGCMGQVKRNNNRVMVFPTTTAITVPRSTSATNHGGNIKYSKLKRIFSGRNVLATPSRNLSTITCRRKMITEASRDNLSAVSVNVAELDPPLPVIRKMQKPSAGGDGDSLWKRRSARGALKTLQIQQISVPKQCLQSTSVMYDDNLLN